MEFNFSSNQREIYKLVEKLTTKKFKSELELLTSLVRDLVNQPEFEIIGGRVWQLRPNELVYELKYQYGSISTIPAGYTFPVTDHPDIFAKLLKERTALSLETDEMLKKSGITLYSVAGVGEIIRTKEGKFYEYLLGFNAPQILQSFYETLNVISSVATIALRNLATAAEKQRITQDITKASEIQRNLFPDHVYKFFDYNIFGVCIPDEAVGGDYFDYLLPQHDEDDNLGIVISDAASKGLSAAIQALFVSGALRMAKRFSPKISYLMKGLNNLIYETFPFERFVTLFYCELTMSSNHLVLYANAGHCPPIIYKKVEDKTIFLKSTGGLLGLMENQKFLVENFQMDVGDVLVLYTDGITEGRNKEGAIFGEERLCEIIKKYHNETPKMIAGHILDEIQKFVADSDLTDDKTLVIVKREPS